MKVICKDETCDETCTVGYECEFAGWQDLIAHRLESHDPLKEYGFSTYREAFEWLFENWNDEYALKDLCEETYEVEKMQ